ncbi:hypothetical protein J0A68_21310 [Algoriphagus sp. H41]|uniref:Uncharacterized protein n=1 Tax=Algoriphagus oliviformis TaxID=2811231 RepID=A0ABS3CAE0_9BACT|nr:hypothetical protein [Algoriphagus oliviformis]MBN7813509.1 hypothetical protein [Algoriphagus oliviformis]
MNQYSKKEVLLKVDYATENFEFAIAEQAAHVRYNLSNMESLRKNVTVEKLVGKKQSYLITVFGRWVVVFNLVEDDEKGDQSSMLFFRLGLNLDLLKDLQEDHQELQDGIIQTMKEYSKTFDPKRHDYVKLVLEHASQNT